MLSKFCDRCHKRLRIGEQCRCFTRYKDDNNIEDFYSTKSWIKARTYCAELCCGLDLYSLFVNRIIEYGRTVHHIVPLKTDTSLALDQTNLIYLTESNHRLIHSMYESGEYESTVELLKTIKAQFVAREGLYEKLFEQ